MDCLPFYICTHKKVFVISSHLNANVLLSSTSLRKVGTGTEEWLGAGVVLQADL